MDTITFAQFKEEIKAQIWPNGVPENLSVPIEKYFADALIHIQRFVECLQQEHIDVFPSCATYFKCGLTVLEAPRGRIARVYTIQDGQWCNPIHYTQAKVNAVLCWSRRFMELVTPPANVDLPALPMGYRYAESSTDSMWGRALIGMWGIEKGRLFVAPWLQSSSISVIQVGR